MTNTYVFSCNQGTLNIALYNTQIALDLGFCYIKIFMV